MKKARNNRKNTANTFINEQGNKLLCLVFIIYALLEVYGINYHEPWRDEAQAWLLVRDTNISTLLGTLPYEGHPPLWYFLIMPIVKLGLPYAIQNYLCITIMIGAVGILLFKTRLPLLIKCILPFSYFMLYEYAFFARSYCMIVFFIAAIISIYPQRFNRPWLFALCVIGLFNTHMLLFTFSATLLLLYLIDAYRLKKLNKHIWAAIGAMALGGLYLLPYLVSSKMVGSFVDDVADYAISRAIQHGLVIDGSSTLAIVLLLIVMAGLIRQPHLLLLLIGGIAGVLYILGYRYPGSIRHEGIILLIILAVYALQQYYPTNRLQTFTLFKYNYITIVAILLIQLRSSINSYARDIAEPYSDAKNAAIFIKEQNLQHKLIVGQDAWAVSAILPYIPEIKQVYYSEYQSYGTYYQYKSWYKPQMVLHSPDNALNMAYLHFAKQLQNIVIVVNHEVQPAGLKYVDKIYASPDIPIRTDEAFYIYKFKKEIR